MTEDARAELEGRLDRLLSEFRDRLKTADLAGTLVSTANGLLQLDLPRAKWDADERVVSLPFVDAADLESALDELLTLRAICVPLSDELPMITDVTLRIFAAGRSVDLQATTVQSTRAGVVFKVTEKSVEAQRAVIALTAALRSRPREQVSYNAKAVRLPNITSVEDIPPAPVELVSAHAPAPESPSEAPQPAVELEPPAAKTPAPSQEARPMETAPVKTELTERIEELEAVESRLHRPNLFEVIGIHFSATRDDVNAAAAKLRKLTDPGTYPEADAALLVRLERVRARCEEVSANLLDDGRRQAHRSQVADPFQIESLVDMYERQIETAKLRREIHEAVAALRRLVEIQPENADARHQLAALCALARDE